MTDKLHFDDLTKITCPFGLLDDDTRNRLLEWEHNWEFFNQEKWSKHPAYSAVSPEITYRAKPIHIPWDVLNPEIQWVTYDDASGWVGWDVEPKLYPLIWFLVKGNRFNCNCLDLPPHPDPETAKFKRPKASK